MTCPQWGADFANDLIDEEKGERITSFQEMPLTELDAVTRNLRAIEADWRDWEHYRAIVQSGSRSSGYGVSRYK